mgnify:CR=1 FL=1
MSGRTVIGKYVRIGEYSALFGGKNGIILEDFSGLSSRCVIYAESDDYSGSVLTNPTVDDGYRNIIGGQVSLRKHVIVGTGTSIMPGVEIGEGTAVGSMSLVNRSLDKWSVYAGIPCKYIKERQGKLLEFEQDFLVKRAEEAE